MPQLTWYQKADSVKVCLRMLWIKFLSQNGIQSVSEITTWCQLQVRYSAPSWWLLGTRCSNHLQWTNFRGQSRLRSIVLIFMYSVFASCNRLVWCQSGSRILNSTLNHCCHQNGLKQLPISRLSLIQARTQTSTRSLHLLVCYPLIHSIAQSSHAKCSTIFSWACPSHWSARLQYSSANWRIKLQKRTNITRKLLSR